MAKRPLKTHRVKISSSASAANTSDFVQIPLSQVPRRETFRSTRTLVAGALVDGVLRFCNSYFAIRQHGPAQGERRPSKSAVTNAILAVSIRNEIKFAASSRRPGAPFETIGVLSCSLFCFSFLFLLLVVAAEVLLTAPHPVQILLSRYRPDSASVPPGGTVAPALGPTSTT
jgi:hypothetical protein